MGALRPMHWNVIRGITAAASLKLVDIREHDAGGETVIRGITAAASLKHAAQMRNLDVLKGSHPRHHCRGLIEAWQPSIQSKRA